jgi:RHS repeat-associated protein
LAYNGDGIRTSKTVAGDTTQYIQDLAATLPVVISDTEAVYLYGLDIIAQQQSERLYYVHDGLGSVRDPSAALRAGLVDTTGQIETNYAYEPFGVPLVGGDVYNPYQFTGEAWDAEVGLLYLRARYYQPEVGRFISKDPWAGDLWRPGTLNSYVYVLDSPVNRIDPSGLQEPSRVQAEPWPGAPPTSTPSSSSGEPPWPQPTAAPTVPLGPSSTPSASDITRQLISQLAADYGIHIVRRMQVQSFGYRFEWTYQQLALVGEAAGDFADKMQGKELGFRARMAPVALFRSPEGFSPHGMGGWTTIIGVLLTGDPGAWRNRAGMKWVIVHELAHWWDLTSGFRLSAGMVTRGMWIVEQATCRTPRGDRLVPRLRVMEWPPEREKPLNILEDWADSAAAYVYPEHAEQVKPPRGPKVISESRWIYVAEEMNPAHAEPYPWFGVSFGGG